MKYGQLRNKSGSNSCVFEDAMIWEEKNQTTRHNIIQQFHVAPLFQHSTPHQNSKVFVDISNPTHDKRRKHGFGAPDSSNILTNDSRKIQIVVSSNHGIIRFAMFDDQSTGAFFQNGILKKYLN